MAADSLPRSVPPLRSLEDGLNNDDAKLAKSTAVKTKLRASTSDWSKEFYFSFVNTNNNHSIYSTINKEDLIAIAPMFREFCGMKMKNDYVIVPVKKEIYYLYQHF